MKRVVIDTSKEKRLLIGLIVSDRICKELLPIIRKEWFEIPYSKKIFDWVSRYYKEYNIAPKLHIKDFYDSEKRKLDDGEAEMISTFLANLSSDFEKWKTFNEEYLINKSIEFLDEISLKYLSSTVDQHVKEGRINRAKDLIGDYRKISRSLSKWCNPFDEKQIIESMDFKRDVLFKFPGKLGDFLGGFERGNLMAILAPQKRGKTWFLVELAVQALLNRLNVAFISLEMRREKMNRRFYKRMTSFVDSKGGDVIYPVFDCMNNQDGSCTKKQRKNKVTLLVRGMRPEFSVKMRYRPCTYCREKKLDDYIPESWWTVVKRPAFRLRNVQKQIKGFVLTFGERLRLICYPRYSANLSTVRADLDLLEYNEEFMPDVIIIDYADILSPEHRVGERRDQIDETWMVLAQISDERRCLVATVSQSNRASWNLKNVGAQHVAEDYRKLAHVDMMYSLNQTREEKRRRLMRLSKVTERESYYDEGDSITLIQNLSAGQPALDADFLSISEKEEKEENNGQK